jgi:hypothetical protein
MQQQQQQRLVAAGAAHRQAHLVAASEAQVHVFVNDAMFGVEKIFRAGGSSSTAAAAASSEEQVRRICITATCVSCYSRKSRWLGSSPSQQDIAAAAAAAAAHDTRAL